MPELPEVETVCQGIKSSILGAKFSLIKLYRPDLRWPLPKSMDKRLRSSKVVAVRRRGKYILISTDNDCTLIVHLGMSGRIIIAKEGHIKEEAGAFYHNTLRRQNKFTDVVSKHDHVIFIFDCPTGERIKLIFNDARRFGAIDLANTRKTLCHKWLQNLGPEPLESDFSVKYLKEKVKKKGNTIKAALLDQSFVSGIGNIYASEILWHARISPLRICNTLNIYEIRKLMVEIRNVLSKAILKGGSSLKDFRNTDGDLGYFQMYFNVYDREGKGCRNKKCCEYVKKIVQNGRSSFFCNSCQH